MELLENLKIEQGTTVLLGAPSKPFEKKISDELIDIASKLESAIEVHAPQCFAVGVMSKPEQILVVVVKNDSTKDSALVETTKLMRESKVIQDILVWILPLNNDFLTDVRAAKCQLKKNKSSKWRFWNKVSIITASHHHSPGINLSRL